VVNIIRLHEESGVKFLTGVSVPPFERFTIMKESELASGACGL
jgi:hypothetical protein